MQTAKELVLDPASPKEIEAQLAKRFLDPKSELAEMKKDAVARQKQIGDLVAKVNKNPELKSVFTKNPLEKLEDFLGPYDTVTVDLQPRLGGFHALRRECSYVYTWEERLIYVQGRPYLVMAHVLKQVCIWLR